MRRCNKRKPYGGNNFNKTVADFTKDEEVIAVCPEVAGGLPVPRAPAEIVNGRVTAADGTDVDDAFRRGASVCLQQAVDAGAELAILQPRSPSCGVRQIYDGTFTKTLVGGQGVFAAMLRKTGIRTIEPDEIDT